MAKRETQEQVDPVEQAGAVPYRIGEDGRVEVLLITNQSGRWIVPKGMIDEGHTPRKAALAEAWEEAGVTGTLEYGELGAYTYEKWGRMCRVRLFALRVERVFNKWLERHHRERRWVSVEEAAERVKIGELKRVLGRLGRERRRHARAA